MKRALIAAIGFVLLLHGVTAPARAAEPNESAAPGAAAAVIEAARSYVGLPYRVGREGPDLFDCSGLVFRAFADAGQLSRVGGRRLRAAGYMRWFGDHDRFVAGQDGAEPGDLVIYGAGKHIGIYVGAGRVISALVEGVTIHRLDGISYPVSGILKVDWSGDGHNPARLAHADRLPVTEPEAPAELIPALPWLTRPADPADGVAAHARRGQVDRADMRTPTSRTFDNGDGTFTTELFSGPVYFQPSAGEGWQPIELRFAAPEEGSPAVVSERAPVAVTLVPADEPDGFIRAGTAEHTIGLGVPAARRPNAEHAVKPVIGGDGRYADYDKILQPGIGLRVFPRADGFRAFVAIAERPRTNQVHLSLIAPGLAVAPEADGSVSLHDAAAHVVARLPAPLVLDSSDVDGNGGGIAAAPASLTADGAPEQRRLTINLDGRFMARATYPVYVAISLTGLGVAGDGDAGQAFAVSRYPDLALAGFQRPEWPAHEELWHGRLPGSADQAEAYLQFANLAATFAGVSVESALLRFQPYWQHDRADDRPTWVEAVGSEWSAATLTWSNRPPRGADLEQLATQAGAWSQVELTDYIRAALDGNAATIGLRLHADEELLATWKRIVAGSEADPLSLTPRLVVNWSGLRPTGVTRRSGLVVPELLDARTSALTWTQAALAPAQTKYEAQVSADGFRSLIAESGRVGGTAGSGSAWSLPRAVLTAGAEYAWRVRVRYGESKSWSAWSKPLSFVYQGVAAPAE